MVATGGLGSFRDASRTARRDGTRGGIRGRGPRNARYDRRVSELEHDPSPRPPGTAFIGAQLGCLLAVVLAFVVALGLLGHEIWMRSRATVAPQAPVSSPKAPPRKPAPPRQRMPEGPSAEAEAPPVTPETAPVFDDSPMPPADPDPPRALAVLQAELDGAYRRKLANPEWIAWNDRPGIPRDIQKFPEELRIQELLGEMARSPPPPRDHAGVRPIPRRDAASVAVTIDGMLTPGEWDDAAWFEIGSQGRRTRLLLVTDERRLLIACHAFDDTTEAGYDQLRFYFHVDLSPIVVNERIHVGHGRTTVIRQTTLEWAGPPPENEDGRWRRFPISDWNVHGHARGVKSMIDGHVVYEASLSLVESGIPLDAPFPAFVEVETDPVETPDGRFVRRVIVGELGSQEEPVWFRIVGR